MIGPYYTISGILKTKSPLHVGTGESVTIPGIGPDEGPLAEIAQVALDYDELPYLPGSALKGVMRRLVSDGAAREALFGPENINDPEKAEAGSLIVWNAWAVAGSLPTGNAMTAAPYAGMTPQGETKTLAARGLYVESRTAIDPAKGVAEDGKLFHQIMLAPGAEFQFEMALEHRRGHLHAQALANLLARMETAEGISLGSGTRTGQGHLCLKGDVTTTSVAVPAEESITAVLDNRAAPAVVPGARTFRLTGEGPFFISDAAKVRKKNKNADPQTEETRTPQLQALLTADGGEPRLPGSALLGALRARAVWLARLKCPGHRDDRMTVLRPGQNPLKDLSLTERLFGVAGWRGLVRIVSISYEGGQMAAVQKEITSVKLDRFSGAPIDTGLFTVKAVLDPVFEVAITLDTTRSGAPTKDDIALLMNLYKDLHGEGLMLGHATNRGYGWFKVEKSQNG